MSINQTAIPFRLTGVSTNPRSFILKDACVIRHDRGQLFTGIAQAKLPQEFAERCQSLHSVNHTWTDEYAIALYGKVVSTDDEVEAAFSYRVLGWPHHVVHTRQFVEE